MTAMFIIFFVEFASSRYLASIDEKVIALQHRESGTQNTVIEPVTKFLTRRKVVINGKQVAISAALAGEAAERVAETFLHESINPEGEDEQVDEASALLEHSDGHVVMEDKG